MKNFIFSLSLIMVFLVGYKVGTYTQKADITLIENPTDSEVKFDDMTPVGAKCTAITKKGSQCTRKAKNGLFCKQHTK